MINPFKYTYRITERLESGEIWYEVEYGNFLSRQYLCQDGELRSDLAAYICDNYSFQSIDAAKKAIEDHLTTKLKTRLNKPTSKVIQYV